MSCYVVSSMKTPTCILQCVSIVVNMNRPPPIKDLTNRDLPLSNLRGVRSCVLYGDSKVLW